MLVAIDDAPAGPAVVDLDRNDLLGKAAVVVGFDRERVGAERDLVLLLPADPVLAAEVLGRLEHPAGHGVVDAASGHARAHEPIVEHRPAGACAPAQWG